MKIILLAMIAIVLLLGGCSLLNSNGCGDCAAKFSMNPDPNDFIQVKKEPYVDLATLQKHIVYPELAKRAGIEGRVTIRVLVGCDGRPQKHIVDSTSIDVLVPSAVKGVMDMMYVPGECEDGPVPCWVSIPITYKLR